eukprot:COSAG02_NODE_463_length_21833_cov_11.529539_12_plen_81_part_00
MENTLRNALPAAMATSRIAVADFSTRITLEIRVVLNPCSGSSERIGPNGVRLECRTSARGTREVLLDNSMKYAFEYGIGE